MEVVLLTEFEPGTSLLMTVAEPSTSTMTFPWRFPLEMGSMLESLHKCWCERKNSTQSHHVAVCPQGQKLEINVML